MAYVYGLRESYFECVHCITYRPSRLSRGIGPRAHLLQAESLDGQSLAVFLDHLASPPESAYHYLVDVLQVEYSQPILRQLTLDGSGQCVERGIARHTVDLIEKNQR